MKKSIAYVFSACVMLVSGAAQAATLTESDVAGGEFGADFRSPTVVEFGFDRIVGTGGVDSDDYFLFTGLPSGAQELVFSFEAPEGYGWSYSAGGEILFSDAPFKFEWDGERVGKKIDVKHGRPSQELTLSLGDAFSGSFYLAFNFTHGSDLRYAVSAASNAMAGSRFPESGFVERAPSAVPVPPALILLVTGLVGLAWTGRRRRA